MTGLLNEHAGSTAPVVNREARWGARAVVAAAGVLMAFALAPVAVGLVGAVVLHEVCVRPNAWAARYVPPRLAAGITALIVAALVAGPVVWLGIHLTERLPVVLATFADTHPHPPAGSTTPLQAQVAHVVAAARERLPTALSSVGRDLTWSLLNWSIALLGLFYLLTAAPTSWARFAHALPFSPAGTDALRVRVRAITMGVVAGTMLSAAVQGVSVGLGFRLAGIDDALFWGSCAAIATLIPVVGNALVWLPALVLMIVRHDVSGAIAIAISGALMNGIIDRVVRATVSRHVGSVHPMITLVGALAGMQVAGVAGIILGPVALALFFALLDTYRHEYARFSSHQGSPSGSAGRA
jgi:predicted PurR-regulated permease PerM